VNALLYRDGHVCEECVGKRLSWPAVAHKCYKNSRLASSAMVASLATHHIVGTFANHVDTYITLTEFARQKLISDHFPAEKIVVKPNFVISDHPPGTGKGGYALYVGRLVNEKGVDALIEAWTKLGGSQLKLKIVGEGPLRENLVEKAARSSGPEIEFLGWKDTPEVLTLMRDAAYLVFPSQWYEAGCTLVMMEAFASGTPVLASDVGNFSEAIRPGKNGWLFKSGDADDLASMVQTIDSQLVDSQPIRDRCYKEYKERYSPEANYRMLMDIYSQHVGK
jgi:glycosyltransferase involved in cell wall biosynthesis